MNTSEENRLINGGWDCSCGKQQRKEIEQTNRRRVDPINLHCKPNSVPRKWLQAKDITTVFWTDPRARQAANDVFLMNARIDTFDYTRQ